MEHWETALRCFYYLLKIIANAPKALEAISKGWTAFTRWLEGLDGCGAADGVLEVVRMNTSITPLTGTLRASGYLPGARLTMRTQP